MNVRSVAELAHSAHGPMRRAISRHPLVIDMAEIVVVGGGYVGLCTAVAFAEQGHRVTVIDVIPEKVARIKQGRAPFYEPGLEESLQRLISARVLDATTDLAASVRKADFTFLCVGTPQGPDGSQDLSYLRKATEEVGKALRNSQRSHVVVTKSTVVPGTARDVVVPTLEHGSGKRVGAGIGVGSNPEFLKEGTALQDARHPDRIVVGATDETTRAAIWSLYPGASCPRIDVDCTSAEMIKYAANAFLAVKISFANEMANIGDKLGVDWNHVVRGIGDDPRIGHLFLRAGIGFGGSCFPKDVAALSHVGREARAPSKLLDAVLEINERQPLRVVEMLEAALGPVQGKRIALLGLAFKPDTDDVRESRARPVWQALVARGAEVACYDPRASRGFSALEPRADIRTTLAESLEGAHAAVVCTEWPEFHGLAARPDAPPVIIDGRRAVAPGGRSRYLAIGDGGAR